MELGAQNREAIGKNASEIRKAGFIPAEFYGHGMKNEHLAVKSDEFRKVFKEAGENTVITLLVGAKKLPALIYDLKHDPLRGDVTHIDFYGVRMDEKIKTGIPIEFTGEAPAVKEKGGVLNKTLQEVIVEALPGDLPHAFIVDLSILTDIGQNIYIKDLKIAKGVKVLAEEDMPIVGIAEARAEEVAPVVPADVSEVKVETEEKKAERDAEKGAEEKE